MKRLRKKTPDRKQQDDRGFVLATSLMLLALLSLVSLGMYFVGRSSIQSSASAQRSTEAYYYAETGINYITWALQNDAEFDNFTYSGSYVASPFGEPLTPSNASSVGDFSELAGYLWDPGPTGAAGASAVDTPSTVYTDGQLMYFDNSPMGGRAICMEVAATFSNCIDVTLSPADRAEPTMYHISASLPRYVKLEIASDGSVTPSIPPLPHQNPPVVGEDIPTNGVVVWLTAASSSNPDIDLEIFPLDPAGVYSGPLPSSCTGGSLPACPCDTSAAGYATAQACDANAGTWISSYGIAAYAVAYVNGKPTHMLRAVIM
jgi:hypothetical protein